MIKEPWFWQEESVSARFVAGMLSPFGLLYNSIFKAKLSLKKPPMREDCIVICVGNATVGGVGKTPFAIMIYELLRAHGISSAFLTRGYGGRLQGPVPVTSEQHTARDVGDEALLLAKHGPVWVSKDRAAGVNAATQAGHRILIADDGFQNPALQKDFSFLLLHDNFDKGNTHTFPAGPFREPVRQAITRADMVIFVRQALKAPWPENINHFASTKPSCRAALAPVNKTPPLKVHGFCGIGNPQRFAQTLAQAGHHVVALTAFPDHHSYSDHELSHLRTTAEKTGSTLITTEKDFVRLSLAQQEGISILPVKMYTDEPEKLWQTLTARLSLTRADTPSA